MIDLEKIVKEMDYFTNHKIEIGILGDGGTINGKEGGTKEEITVLEYGTYLEFGTSKSAPIPFFRKAIETNQTQISTYIERVVSDVLSGELTGKQAMMQVGEYVRGLVIVSIATAGGWARELSPNYTKWKEKNFPNKKGQTLILDGFLIKSIRYKIKKGSNIVYTSKWKGI